MLLGTLSYMENCSRLVEERRGNSFSASFLLVGVHAKVFNDGY